MVAISASRVIEMNGLEKWGNATLRLYEMDFSENHPRLVKHLNSNAKISYVERLHQSIFEIDLNQSLKHDKLIWQHICDAKNSLYSL